MLENNRGSRVSIYDQMAKYLVVCYFYTGGCSMKQTTENRTASIKKLDQLSSVEKLVNQVLANGHAKSDDLATIAKMCKLTDLQVVVAIQLLIHKKILPSEQFLS